MSPEGSVPSEGAVAQPSAQHGHQDLALGTVGFAGGGVGKNGKEKEKENSSWKGPAMILVQLPAQLETDPNLNYILSLDTSSAKCGLANHLRLTSLSEGAGWDKSPTTPRAGQRNRAAPASLLLQHSTCGHLGFPGS